MKTLLQDIIAWRTSRIANSDEQVLKHLQSFHNEGIGGKQVRPVEFSRLFTSTLACLLLLLLILTILFFENSPPVDSKETLASRLDNPLPSKQAYPQPTFYFIPMERQIQNISIILSNLTECLQIENENETWIKCRNANKNTN